MMYSYPSLYIKFFEVLLVSKSIYGPFNGKEQKYLTINFRIPLYEKEFCIIAEQSKSRNKCILRKIFLEKHSKMCPK